MARRTASISQRTLERFIAELAAGRTVSDAARAAGIPRRTAYDIRQRDEDFALAWHDAIEEGTDVYEEARRARDRRRGEADHVPRPGCHDGPGVNRPAPQLLLKARRPQVYRERTGLEHSGSSPPPGARASGGPGSTRSGTRPPPGGSCPGVTIAQSRLLGHEDPSFTLRTYIHVLPADLPDGDALARAVGLTDGPSRLTLGASGGRGSVDAGAGAPGATPPRKRGGMLVGPMYERPENQNP